MTITEFLNVSFLNNTALQWLIALGLTAVFYIAFKLGIRFALKQLQRVTQWTSSSTDDLIVQALKKTRSWLLFLVALYLGGRWLIIPTETQQWLNAAVVIVLLIQLGIWGDAFIQAYARNYREEHIEERSGQITTMQAISFLGRVFLFSILLILALDNIPGVEVTTLLASLGIGGVAVALAVQNILGDLFASLSIAFDKPFVLGDVIQVGDFVGTVERVGMKTTRVRSLSGEQVVFSNADLLQSRLRNYQKMERRRVVLPFGVTYQTSAEKLREIPSMVQQAVDVLEQATFDRAHLKALGGSSIDFELVYHVEDSDYTLFMDTQQSIILSLIERFADEKIEFAYPTRTLMIEKWPSAPNGQAVEEKTAEEKQYNGQIN